MGSSNRNLIQAKKAKMDEFYTPYDTVQYEVTEYYIHDKNVFRGKVVYCNCDDPFESSFFKFFAARFNQLGLKQLIATSYSGSPIAGTQEDFPEFHAGGDRKGAAAFIIDHVIDEDGNGVVDIYDVVEFLKKNNAARIQLHGDAKYPPGDFRSEECVGLLRISDVVVTNPPFSLFKEFVKQLFDYDKKFLIIGNLNAVTYKEIFPLVKDNKMWLGVTLRGVPPEFRVPDSYPLFGSRCREENGVKYIRVKGVRWFTNLPHGVRSRGVEGLMTMEENLRFNKRLEGTNAYKKYDNYDAIEVPYTRAIPSDYDGYMGVPKSFLDYYCPEQFEIAGTDRQLVYSKYGKVSSFFIDGKEQYARVVIRHRRPRGER